MKQKYLILVCTSRLPKLQSVGCCQDREGAQVLEALQNRISDLGLGDEVQVKASGCLTNCSLGVSLKVFPGPFLYGEMKPGDLEELIEQHLIFGTPLDRLLIPNNSFPGL